MNRCRDYITFKLWGIDSHLLTFICTCKQIYYRFINMKSTGMRVSEKIGYFSFMLRSEIFNNNAPLIGHNTLQAS